MTAMSDAVLFDLLPDGIGLALASEIKARNPGARVVLFEFLYGNPIDPARVAASSPLAGSIGSAIAAIHALETLERPSTITIITDSAYVKNGVTGWIHGWKRNGWKTAAKKPVANVELWQRLDAAQARHQVTWEWVKGHAGHPENERADALARAGMKPFKKSGT